VKEQLLPYVTNEVGFSVAQTLCDSDAMNVKRGLSEIKKVNPAVEEFIRKWSCKGRDRIHSALCGMLVYKLLESQAEADMMSDLIRLEP
jgi:hypothetical protein